MTSFHPPAVKTYKPTVEDCIALDMAMLRKSGMLLEFMDHRLQRRWQLDGKLIGDIFLSTTFTGDIPYPSLRIEGACFGRPVMQSVPLISRRMRFGGKRWHFMCPSTKRPCCKIILPPGGHSFASVKGWGLSYRSQYDNAVTRSTKAIEALTARSEALSKFTRTRTREALQERIQAKNEFLDRFERRYVEDLYEGRRASLRRAAKMAANKNI